MLTRAKLAPLELLLLLYVLCYVPNVLLTKLVTTGVRADLDRPLSGAETVPASLLVNLALTYLFIWLSGWYRDAHQVRLANVSLPVPTRYTALSAVGSALVLCTVPLSFTFASVSIPYIQLLMRGDILLIAPLVDLLFGRRVRWWSWVALVTVAIAIGLVVQQRGGLKLPPLAIATVALYTFGYFLRLAVMTRVAKNGDAAAVRRYFVEEKLVSLPLSVVILAGVSVLTPGARWDDLGWAFAGIWSDAAVWPMIGVGVTMVLVSVCASLILLAPQENSYCVPLERSAGLLAGIIAAWALHWGWGLDAPTRIEMLGASLLIGAIVLLTVAPRWSGSPSVAVEHRLPCRTVVQPEADRGTG
jgi:hypothetical protein